MLLLVAVGGWIGQGRRGIIVDGWNSRWCAMAFVLARAARGLLEPGMCLNPFTTTNRAKLFLLLASRCPFSMPASLRRLPWGSFLGSRACRFLFTWNQECPRIRSFKASPGNSDMYLYFFHFLRKDLPGKMVWNPEPSTQSYFRFPPPNGVTRIKQLYLKRLHLNLNLTICQMGTSVFFLCASWGCFEDLMR